MNTEPDEEIDRLLALGYKREDIVVLPGGEVVLVEQNEFEGAAKMLRQKRIETAERLSRWK